MSQQASGSNAATDEPDDPFNLERFMSAQDARQNKAGVSKDMYLQAFEEMKGGVKEGHWYVCSSCAHSYTCRIRLLMNEICCHISSLQC